jgi:hypothetical protein
MTLRTIKLAILLVKVNVGLVPFRQDTEHAVHRSEWKGCSPKFGKQVEKIRYLSDTSGLEGCQSSARKRLVSEREEVEGTWQPNPRLPT